MSKKANWVKFQADMYDNKKLKYIDSLEDNNLIYYIWTGTILLAGKCNRDGELYLSNSIPYTVKTLAIEFRRTVDEVAKAYDVLCELEMIELTEDKVFCLPGWSEYQSIDGLDKIRKQTNERVARYREKKREERRAAEEINKAEDNDAVENHIKQSEDYTDGEIAQADGQNNEDGMVDVNSNDSNAADGDKANDDAGSILEDNINEDENCIEEQATKSTSEKTKSEKSEFGKTES
ncbi:MAG: phage replisome organizer N-terminal domain-containing protein, partial [Clostridium sp.]|nr:phage replisome organizer N-terminal domain-containing protein [Clostridium sp.]